MNQDDYPEDEVDHQLRAFRAWMVRKFRDARFAEILGLGLTVALIVLGVIGACIYYGQLEEMRHTNNLTQQALDANGETLRQTLAKMQLQVDATNGLKIEAQKQTPQIITQATAARNAAKTAQLTLESQSTADLLITITNVSAKTIDDKSDKERPAAMKYRRVSLTYVINNYGYAPALYTAGFSFRQDDKAGTIPVSESEACQSEISQNTVNYAGLPEIQGGEVTKPIIVEQPGFLTMPESLVTAIGCVAYTRLSDPDNVRVMAIRVVVNVGRYKGGGLPLEFKKSVRRIQFDETGGEKNRHPKPNLHP